MTQRLTTAYVHQIFRNLESGDGKGFFEHVADDVDWIVEGTHPLAGRLGPQWKAVRESNENPHGVL